MTNLQRTFSSPDGVHPPTAAYSHLARVKASEYLFIAGQVAVDADGKLVGEGDVAAQAYRVFRNIAKILESAGASPVNIVALTTYVVGRESVQPYLDARPGIYAELFPDGEYPPNTLLVVSGLVLETQLVEVTALAALA